MCACRRAKSFLIADILAMPDAGQPPPRAASAGAGWCPLRRHTYPVCPLPLRYPPPAAPPLPPLPPQPMRHAYSLDTGAWWRVRGAGDAGEAGGAARRAGGQVRFSAVQATALERRFSTARYLSPEQRRRLARELRLSDRQVKTWFQNRRAKWRRAAPGGGSGSGSSHRGPDDSAGAGSGRACERSPARPARVESVDAGVMLRDSASVPAAARQRDSSNPPRACALVSC